jgi:hypothetical protein
MLDLNQLLDQEFEHTENEKMVTNFSFLLDEKVLLEYFLNSNCTRTTTRPGMMATTFAHPTKYPEQQFGKVRVLCFQSKPNAILKIFIPSQ